MRPARSTRCLEALLLLMLTPSCAEVRGSEIQRNVERFMQEHPAASGERHIYMQASTYDGYYAYVLVQGEEAIQRLTRGLVRRVRLDPKVGLGARLAPLDEKLVASLRNDLYVEDVQIDGVDFYVELKVGSVERKFRFKGTEPPSLYREPELDLVRRLAPYLESRERMPDPLGEPEWN